MKRTFGFSKIAVKTFRQEVYEQLRDKIISAEILPGEAISLRELAEDFGVSLMPVREAVRQLESEKIIIVESNKKIRVNSLTAKEMEEALELRLLLESRAAEKACELRPDNAIPKLGQLLEGMIDAVSKPRIFMRRNTQFHFSIYSYSDSPLLLEMIGRLWARVGPYVYNYAIITQDMSNVIPSHQEMLQGFTGRNSKRITNAIRLDLENAAKVIIPYLEKNNLVTLG